MELTVNNDGHIYDCMVADLQNLGVDITLDAVAAAGVFVIPGGDEGMPEVSVTIYVPEEDDDV